MKRKAKADKNSNQSNRGITLVALVVTIVVLIILATISINAVLRRKWINQKSTASTRIA